MTPLGRRSKLCPACLDCDSDAVAIRVAIHTPGRYEKAAPDFSETASHLLELLSG
jgi:hypothetical protein